MQGIRFVMGRRLASYIASVYSMLAPERGDSNDLEMLSKEYVRCKEGWQAGKEWRRD